MNEIIDKIRININNLGAILDLASHIPYEQYIDLFENEFISFGLELDMILDD